MNNIPKAYKDGYIEFYKLRFKVTPDVLIPRPETELLVDEVLNHIRSTPRTTPSPKPITVIDVGTGAGNIAISIAKNTPNITIIATDISDKALKIAKLNAKFHGVQDKIVFIKSNLLSSPSLSPYILNTTYSILITNLPYIPTARIPYLDSSVKDYEPHVALDGGEDGFGLYRKLFKQVTNYDPTTLKWQIGLIVGEIDYTHGELAVSEAQKYFPQSQIEVKTDLAHKQRILLISNPDFDNN